MLKYEINSDLLKKRIVKKFGSEAKFYNALGISKQAYYYKIKAKSVSIQSLIAFCNLLDITENTFKDYFLTKVE